MIAEVEEALSSLRVRARWLRPRRVGEPLGLDEAFRRALANPLRAPNLLEERGVERAAIIIPDHTRPPSPFLAKLVGVVEALAREVVVVVAGGTHQPPPLSRIRDALGGLVEKSWFRLRHSYAQSHPSNFKGLGVTSRGTPIEVNREVAEADLVVSTLCVRPHYFAGWEGGCKAILPGCSSLNSIRHNHSLAVGCPEARELRAEGNPVRMDMEEAGMSLARRTRYRVLDWVIDSYGGLAAAYYGDPVGAHRASAQAALNYYVVEAPPSQAVVTIARPPIGSTLFQALKAYHLACSVEPRQGKLKVVLAAPMDEGVGSKEFAEEVVRYANRSCEEVVKELKERMMRGEFSEVFPKLARMAMDSQRAKLIVASPSAASDVKTLLEKANIPFYEDLAEALRGIEEAVVLPYGDTSVPVSPGSSRNTFMMSV
ncbi:MAG: lactate racemase domain-containing protein [Candidatus Nezhaarchaeota archaeon]|nr:lactate racemase domain-containing protein [Candidatus Nezhaarchaeota archaeon]